MDNYFSKFINYANSIFSVALDPNDMVSLYHAKKILKSSYFIYNNTTKVLSENSASSAIFIAINLGTVVYQYLYASWFLYLTTTLSGIKKLYMVILQNPILGIFFYFSFYFKIISEPDREKFNHIAGVLNLNKHEDFLGRNFIGQLADKIANVLAGVPLLLGYKHELKNILHKVFSENVMATLVEGTPVKLARLLTHTVEAMNAEFSNSRIATALYVENRTVETQRDYDELAEFLSVNRRDINREVKKTVGGKKKNQRKLKLQQIVETKTPGGDVICLDVCKSRTKTTSGCYCEGDCGPTIFLGGKSWCFVDPNKCKNGKYLRKTFGKSWDTCTGELGKPTCYTGLAYKNCRKIE